MCFSHLVLGHWDKGAINSGSYSFDEEVSAMFKATDVFVFVQKIDAVLSASLSILNNKKLKKIFEVI